MKIICVALKQRVNGSLYGRALGVGMTYIWKSITGPESEIDKHFVKVAAALTITVVFMGTGRHVYRANALEPHQALVKAKTKEFQRLSAEARANPMVVAETIPAESAVEEFAEGAAIFKQNCSACHKQNEKLVGPPMTEMVAIYKDDVPGLKNWIKRPGKKREDAPQMPGFPMFSEEEMSKLTDYILSIKTQ